MKVLFLVKTLIINELAIFFEKTYFKTFIFIEKVYFYKVLIKKQKYSTHIYMTTITTKKTTTAPLKWTAAMKLLAVMQEQDELAESRLLFALGFYTGLRISDILRLRWSDLEQPFLVLNEKKTGKERRIDFNAKLLRIVAQTRKVMRPENNNDFIFKGKRGPQREKSLTVVGANNRIKAIFEQFDIATQNPSSHTLRKTFALRVYDAHQRSEDALILLSEMFNHNNISITRKYIGITQERITNVYLNL